MDFRMVPIGQIEARPVQVRQEFDRDFLKDLSESIKQDEMLVPLLVRPTGEDGHFEIIAGEQRWRAARMAGLKEVPVSVVSVDEPRAVELAFVENEKRKALSSKEREDAIAAMWGGGHYQTQEELAAAVGVTRTWIVELLAAHEDRCKLGFALGVSTPIIRETRGLDETSRRALVDATQKGDLPKEAHVVGKITTVVKRAPESARPVIVKAMADDNLPLEDAAEIADIATDKGEARELARLHKTQGPAEFRKAVTYIKREKAAGRKPVVRTVIKGPVRDWAAAIEGLRTGCEGVLTIKPAHLADMDRKHRAEALALVRDLAHHLERLEEALGA